MRNIRRYDRPFHVKRPLQTASRMVDLDGPTPVLEPSRVVTDSWPWEAAARFRQPGGGVQDECSASAVRRRSDSWMTCCCPSSRRASCWGRLTFTLIEVPVPASASCQNDVDVGDLAGDRDPFVGLVNPQFLRHREVGVPGRPLGELTWRVFAYGLDADPPVREPGRVEEQLPHFLHRRTASGAQREPGHQGTSATSSSSAISAVSRRSSHSGSTRPTIGGRPRSTKLARNSAPASCSR